MKLNTQKFRPLTKIKEYNPKYLLASCRAFLSSNNRPKDEIDTVFPVGGWAVNVYLINKGDTTKARSITKFTNDNCIPRSTTTISRFLNEINKIFNISSEEAGVKFRPKFFINDDMQLSFKWEGKNEGGDALLYVVSADFAAILYGLNFNFNTDDNLKIWPALDMNDFQSAEEFDKFKEKYPIPVSKGELCDLWVYSAREDIQLDEGFADKYSREPVSVEDLRLVDPETFKVEVSGKELLERFFKEDFSEFLKGELDNLPLCTISRVELVPNIHNRNIIQIRLTFQAAPPVKKVELEISPLLVKTLNWNSDVLVDGKYITLNFKTHSETKVVSMDSFLPPKEIGEYNTDRSLVRTDYSKTSI